MNIRNICMHCMSDQLNEYGECAACGKTEKEIKATPWRMPLRTILKGKYLIGKVIGEGGFGITYIGYDLDLEICVAIKEFCPKSYVSRDAADGITIYLFDESKEEVFAAERDKFINEARRLAKFRNEDGVVSVMDYFMENGTAYIVMDYIDGITLKSYLKTLRDTTSRNMNMAGVLNLFKPVMEALVKIHKAGIIHRDISPENIMISKDFTKAYLIDFGTARNMESDHTLSEYHKGFYTPIEQRTSQSKGKMEQGPWTDVYALCATIYLCITGRVMPDSVARIAEDDIIMPSKFGVTISPEMEAVLMHGLAVKPQDRIRSVEELMQGFYSADKPEEAKTQEETVDVEKKVEEVETHIYPQTISMKNEGTMTKSDAGKTAEKKGKGKKIFLRILAAIIVGGIIMCGVEYSKLHTTVVGSYYDPYTNTNYESAKLKQERIHDKQSGKYLIQSETMVADNQVLLSRTWDGKKITTLYSNGYRGVFQVTDGSKYSKEKFGWMYTLTDAYGNCKTEYVWARSVIVDTEFTKTLAVFDIIPDINPTYVKEYIDGEISEFTDRESGIRTEYFYGDDYSIEKKYNLATQELESQVLIEKYQIYGHKFDSVSTSFFNKDNELEGVEYTIKNLDDDEIILQCDEEGVLLAIEGNQDILWKDTKERITEYFNQSLKQTNRSELTYTKDLDLDAEEAANDFIRNGGKFTVASNSYICCWGAENPVTNTLSFDSDIADEGYKKVGFSIRKWNGKWIIVAVFD